MMLVQQVTQPPPAPPPQPISEDIHARVNDDAPASILQLGKAQWAATHSKPTSTSTTPSKRPSTPRIPKPAFTIRPATSADAEQIRAIGVSVFSETFGFSIPPADLQAYIASSYALSAIQAELASPSHHFVVACRPGSPSTVLGFAQMTEHTTEPCLSHLPRDSTCELQRLYVRADSHGQGIGKALTSAVESVAREEGYRYMWLGVWEGNFVAQTVYERAGFSRIGDHEFTMGRCVQIDWIMVKEL